MYIYPPSTYRNPTLIKIQYNTSLSPAAPIPPAASNKTNIKLRALENRMDPLCVHAKNFSDSARATRRHLYIHIYTKSNIFILFGGRAAYTPRPCGCIMHSRSAFIPRSAESKEFAFSFPQEPLMEVHDYHDSSNSLALALALY